MDPENHVATSLNMDIMHIVMSFADRRAVSSLMKTCSTLNSEGAKYILTDGVFLRHERGLMSFIWFLIARNGSSECRRRLTFLKKLSLDFYPPTEVAAGILEGFFELVPVTSGLICLEISEAEALLAMHPPLGVAIAKLTRLKTLNLSDAGEHCALLLRTLRSSLVFADITFVTSNGEPEDEATRRSNANPILLLEGSQSTLESLSTNFATSSPDGPRYTNVTSLTLMYIDLLVIEDYIRAFPNVRTLSSSECSGFREDRERWEDRRATSMLHQARHGTWRSLRHYVGTVLDLWTFGLACQIRTVGFGVPQNRMVQDPDMLNDVLSDARPSALDLMLPGASYLLDEALRSVLSVERGLRELDLRVLLHINGNDEIVSVGDVLDLLVDVVRASAVAAFRLKLDMSWIRDVRTRAERSGEEGPPIMPFEVYLQDMDVDAYTDALLAKVASLREVQVSVVWPGDGRTRQADRKRTERVGGSPTSALDGSSVDGDSV
ncbi:hypothetical protein GSI_15582 [Ganoderma sinense ZZ0214-1]|uniref:F-box domain-containing protein n=1 Tax=Ganoderma sinense ZZ0214-1 TaxID=1077348 RepID=A0A2G8RMZ7_9APHY|nr:hypothetical protein GSI_15582 [Ganoderma sinense ZZ0214-1]